MDHRHPTLEKAALWNSWLGHLNCTRGPRGQKSAQFSHNDCSQHQDLFATNHTHTRIGPTSLKNLMILKQLSDSITSPFHATASLRHPSKKTREKKPRLSVPRPTGAFHPHAPWRDQQLLEHRRRSPLRSPQRRGPSRKTLGVPVMCPLFVIFHWSHSQ